MYASGGEFTENIDSYGGEGTALFTAKAIIMALVGLFFCRKLLKTILNILMLILGRLNL